MQDRTDAGKRERVERRDDAHIAQVCQEGRMAGRDAGQ